MAEPETNSERESKLIKGFNDNEKEDNPESKDPKKIMKCIIIACIIITVIVGVIVVLAFIVLSKNDDDGNSNEDEYHEESYNEIDTIPNSEMNRARAAFKQYYYIDPVNSSLILEYNLFIPSGYTNEKKYPLVLFIEDGSLVNPDKDIKAPITETVGGPIWATDRMQKKYECFVLAPEYRLAIIDDNHGYSKSEYINVTVRLIKDLMKNYTIDENRLYSTGQSMGAMTTLYILANFPNFLAAGLICDGQWRMEELVGIENATFTYIAAGGDLKAFTGQSEVKKKLDDLNIPYGNLPNINAKDNITELNNNATNMYNLKYSKNFITFINGTVLPSKKDIKSNEHMYSFKYGYRIDAVRDWLLSQFKQN